MAGYTSIPNWVACGPRLSANAKVVLLVIASRSGSKGSCYPSINAIARDSGVSRSTVKRALDELGASGIISVIPRKTGRGQTSSVYRMLIDRETPEPEVHSGPGGGSTQDHHEQEPLEQEPPSKTLGGGVQ